MIGRGSRSASPVRSRIARRWRSGGAGRSPSGMSITTCRRGRRRNAGRSICGCWTTSRPVDVDAVIVYVLDRLHRQPRELEEFFEVCDAAGITALASVTGDVDLANADGRFMARILGAVARKESDDKSRRIKRKHEELAKAGKVSGGGTRPYGYEADRRTIRKDEAAVIREAAKRVLAGEGIRSIVRDFDARDIKPAQAESLASSGVATGVDVGPYRRRAGTSRHDRRHGGVAGDHQRRGLRTVACDPDRPGTAHHPRSPPLSARRSAALRSVRRPVGVETTQGRTSALLVCVGARFRRLRQDLHRGARSRGVDHRSRPDPPRQSRARQRARQGRPVQRSRRTRRASSPRTPPNWTSSPRRTGRSRSRSRNGSRHASRSRRASNTNANGSRACQRRARSTGSSVTPIGCGNCGRNCRSTGNERSSARSWITRSSAPRCGAGTGSIPIGCRRCGDGRGGQGRPEVAPQGLGLDGPGRRWHDRCRESTLRSLLSCEHSHLLRGRYGELMRKADPNALVTVMTRKVGFVKAMKVLTFIGVGALRPRASGIRRHRSRSTPTGGKRATRPPTGNRSCSGEALPGETHRNGSGPGSGRSEHRSTPSNDQSARRRRSRRPRSPHGLTHHLRVTRL